MHDVITNPVANTSDAGTLRLPLLTRLMNSAPAASLCLLIVGLLPVLPGGDVNASSFVGRGGFEFVMVLIGGALAFGYAYLRGLMQRLVADPVVLFGLAFSLWALVSSIWSVNPLLSMAKAVEMACMFLVCGVTSSAMSTHNKHYLVFKTLVFSVVMLLAINMIFWGTPLPFTDELDIDSGVGEPDRPRFFLGFGHPLTTADIVAATAIFSLFVRNLNVVFRGVVFLGAVTFLWLTDGRAPLAGFAVALSLGLFAFTTNVRIRLTLIAGGILAMSYFFLYEWGPLVSSLSQSVSRETLSLNGRVGLWSYIVDDLIPNHALLGVGYYSTRFELLKHASWSGTAHNSYFELILGLGAVGVVIAVPLLFFMARSVFKARNAIGISILTYALLHGVMNVLLLAPTFAMVITLLALPSLRVINRDP